ncbi:MAG: SH3 domain-containing protein [Marinoscillum sp.]
MRTLAIILCLLASIQLTAQVKVKGYYRKDGTYVKPHVRSNPDGNPYNNYSYPGNTNPYTGKTATGNPDTYLKNYNNRSSNNNSTTTYSYPSTSSGNSSYSSSYTTTSYYVTANSLNVRSGPSTSYSVTSSLSKADNVTVLETYTNGWKKIRFSYLDRNSFSFETKTGYVSGSYLSTSHPYLNDSYSNSSFYSTNDYSTLERTTSTYGVGKGNLTIWTNCGTDGEIKVYLDGTYAGKVTQYFTDGSPDCGEEGTLSINKPAGTYKFEAKGNQYTWSGTLTITENRCFIQKLND